ncbi:MAG: hypothetical protein ACLSH6_06850 [Limosilactobacillus pontis]
MPIIAYHESRLTVNGKQLTSYQRSSIGAPYVHQRRGKNTATLYFQIAGWFKAMLAVSLTGLALLLFYGLYQFVR